MDELGRAEYKNLRATILQRGTVRAVAFLVTVFAWAVVEILAFASAAYFVAPLLSLMVLAGGFETIFQLHLGVERVGRYLQVAYEEQAEGAAGEAAAPSSAPPAWETTAMAYGATHPSAGSDPLFTWMFLLATLVNLLPLLVAGGIGIAARHLVVACLAFAHAAFLIRVALARRSAGRQRAEDLERFRALLARRSRAL